MENEQKLVEPERIPDSVDNVLDKLFNTTPEQISKYEVKQQQRIKSSKGDRE